MPVAPADCSAADDASHAGPGLLHRIRRGRRPRRSRGAHRGGHRPSRPVTTVRDHDTFCRLLIHGAEDLIVDIAMDSSPSLPPQSSSLGPTFNAQELAGRKVIALLDGAAARDFVDVYMLSSRYSTGTLLSRAQQIDAGFDCRALAEMPRPSGPLLRRGLEPGRRDRSRALRDFFRQWRADSDGLNPALGSLPGSLVGWLRLVGVDEGRPSVCAVVGCRRFAEAESVASLPFALWPAEL